MARIKGLERINRYPAHNKIILKSIFDIEPKRGKLKPIIDFINDFCYLKISQETCSKFSSSDFFFKSPEVFSFISTNKLEFLDSNVSNRSYDINIGKDGFSSYEGIHPSYLKKNKDLILFELNQTDLI